MAQYRLGVKKAILPRIAQGIVQNEPGGYLQILDEPRPGLFVLPTILDRLEILANFINIVT